MAEHSSEDYDLTCEPKLIPFQEINLISGIHSPDELVRIKECEVQDTDVFIITYPKSGTTWMQNIICLIEDKGVMSSNGGLQTSERVPWIELKGGAMRFDSAPSPRIRVTHLSYSLMPLGLRQGKGKMIYMARNPKDVLTSYYHFHYCIPFMESPKDFNEFYERFLAGQVFGGRWFEHFRTWYSHKDAPNFLFITYEEMIKDLRSVVERICGFLGKTLTEEELANVVKHSMFENMCKNPLANYKQIPSSLFDHEKGTFLRKGTVGDWKNNFTVAQSEKFDRIYQEEMKDIPLSFVWDICDLITP